MIEARLTQIDADMVAFKEVLQNLKESVSSIEQQTSFTQCLKSKEEFADICRVSAATISRRLEKGLYDTPKGYTQRAFYNQGNQGNAIFNAPLALNYYEINKKSFHTTTAP